MAAIFLWLHTEGGKLKHRNAVLQVETFKLKLESFHSFFIDQKLKKKWVAQGKFRFQGKTANGK